jgi:hypothetical protein
MTVFFAVVVAVVLFVAVCAMSAWALHHCAA